MGCGKGCAPGMRLQHTFLYKQIEQVHAGPSPTFEFCGFDLTKDEKDRLMAHWVGEYPELPEGESD